ncbi:NAD(+) diphosphatase [Aldersonia sp. NBC_00410]|uniref:NAD(+) diphosphatase n=1 Tax=Aldersonia sp. NBC_00410 TaxID=2975954 RepID=UPI00225B4E46|nr:NAD(+) diphosphatase [Aldersonia sp. NBC_00410]MCX5044597.1 NAD(+) diphosphatase [Aldersonia sp. NBC_00410]
MSDFELIEMPRLSRSTLDRAAELRGNPEVLKEGWPTAKLLRVNRRGQVRVAGADLDFDDAIEFAAEPPGNAVFLGVDGNRHIWAVRVPELEPEPDGKLHDLRIVGAQLDDTSAGILTTAIALLNWHDSAAHSSLDGGTSTAANGGWSRISATLGHEEFPRTDPAVICLVHDGGDRVLLARQHSWPERMFSILAGFVEAGESFEACVAREMREEVGVDVTDIRYLGSQPWPFPRSVMIGFAAKADPAQPLAFSDGEIGEAHWFTRAEVRAALELGDWTSNADSRLLLPGSISIARGIVSSWAAHD